MRNTKALEISRWRFAARVLLSVTALLLRCSQALAQPAAPERVVGVAANIPIYTIDLPTAVALAERANPTIAIAREAIFANLALQQQANAMLFPTLVAGGNLHIHEGLLQRDTGQMLNVNEQSLYLGGGAGAVGGGTVTVPAVRIFAPLSNALFEPLVAQQRVVVSRCDSRAASNEVLLRVIVAYLELVAADASRDAFLRADAEATRVITTVDAFVRVGQARKADSDRARSRGLLIRNQVYRADERVGVAAARLAQLLSLDPSVRLHSVPGPVQAINVVDPSYDLTALIEIALRSRPEMAARNAAIALNEARWSEERWRPLLPTISAGFSAGQFGAGPSVASTAGYQTSGRSDFDVAAVWTLQNAGVGNAALQRGREAEIDVATSDRARTAALVQEQVADAYGTSASRREQLQYTARQLATAESGFREELTRTRGGEGLPIEVLNSLDLLARASQDAITAAIEYDQSQFRLFVAIGNPPSAAVRPRQVPR